MVRTHDLAWPACGGSTPAVAVLAGVLAAAVGGADLALPDRYTAMTLLASVPALSALRPGCPRCALLVGGSRCARRCRSPPRTPTTSRWPRCAGPPGRC
ncbi:hypothetical protein ACFQHO_07615 [Actinomadura yumaensis]|uniref:hypothetical protein n=1 Tax=Actinomadura yumaensis TaxID=111807 RepID=UPI0036167582